MRGFSSRTSSWQSFSASGSLVKVLLQYQLRGDRIDRFLFHAAQPAFRLDRGEALVDARDRKMETTFELPSEFFHSLRQRMLARLADRQADDQSCRTPFLHQGMNLFDARDRFQRMSR